MHDALTNPYASFMEKKADNLNWWGSSDWDDEHVERKSDGSWVNTHERLGLPLMGVSRRQLRSKYGEEYTTDAPRYEVLNHGLMGLKAHMGHGHHDLSKDPVPGVRYDVGVRNAYGDKAFMGKNEHLVNEIASEAVHEDMGDVYTLHQLTYPNYHRVSRRANELRDLHGGQSYQTERVRPAYEADHGGGGAVLGALAGFGLGTMAAGPIGTVLGTVGGGIGGYHLGKNFKYQVPERRWTTTHHFDDRKAFRYAANPELATDLEKYPKNEIKTANAVKALKEPFEALRDHLDEAASHVAGHAFDHFVDQHKQAASIPLWGPNEWNPARYTHMLHQAHDKIDDLTAHGARVAGALRNAHKQNVSARASAGHMAGVNADLAEAHATQIANMAQAHKSKVDGLQGELSAAQGQISELTKKRDQQGKVLKFALPSVGAGGVGAGFALDGGQKAASIADRAAERLVRGYERAQSIMGQNFAVHAGLGAAGAGTVSALHQKGNPGGDVNPWRVGEHAVMGAVAGAGAGHIIEGSKRVGRFFGNIEQGLAEIPKIRDEVSAVRQGAETIAKQIQDKPVRSMYRLWKNRD